MLYLHLLTIQINNMSFLWVIVIVGAFLWFASKNKKNSVDPESSPSSIPSSEESVFQAENKFEKKLENYNLPDAISGKEIYIYRELMKKWYNNLSANNRYNEQVTHKLRSDWLDYMDALEERNTCNYLSLETEGKDSDKYRESHIVASKKVLAIEDAFAVAVGTDAVDELNRARALSFFEFNHEGNRAPNGYQWDAEYKLQKIGEKGNNVESKSTDEPISIPKAIPSTDKQKASLTKIAEASVESLRRIR